MSMTVESPIRLLLVDDHHAFRLPFALMLDDEADLTVVAQADSLPEVRALLPDFAGLIDVALIDLHFPEGNGIDIVREVRTGNPQGHILVLTGESRTTLQAQAIEAGAVGIISKTWEPSMIAAAIRRVHAGYPVQPVQEIVDLLRSAAAERERGRQLEVGLAHLSSREREVLALLAEGLDNKAIGERLHISQETARTHVVKLLAKLGLESRLQAGILAFRQGIEVAP
jgi:DNA-binding NarL/FixJ family response regulator